MGIRVNNNNNGDDDGRRRQANERNETNVSRDEGGLGGKKRGNKLRLEVRFVAGDWVGGVGMGMID